jgi:hypothetical protein
MMLEDLGLEIGSTEPVVTYTIHSPLHEPIEIGEDAQGLNRFWGRAKYLLLNDLGEVEKDDFFIFNIFATSESEAKCKIETYFQQINSRAEQQCMDIELELVDVSIKNLSSD